MADTILKYDGNEFTVVGTVDEVREAVAEAIDGDGWAVLTQRGGHPLVLRVAADSPIAITC